jgi:hypothetical protein
MNTQIKYTIWPLNLDFEKVFAAVETFALKRGFKTTPTLPYAIGITVDPFESITAHSLEEFQDVFKSLPKFESVNGSQWYAKKDLLLQIRVSHSRNVIEVYVDCRDPDIVRLAQEQLKSDFGLRKAPLPSPDSKRATYPQPTVFLGRHFDERASALAQKLMQFLYLIGIDVIEAERYTAQAIPHKVLSLIDRQAIYLGLVTKNPEHDWITGEASYAHGKAKHVILVTEEGAKFNPTILGKDYEQIRFAGDAIETSFIKLLEEFRDIGLRIN